MPLKEGEYYCTMNAFSAGVTIARRHHNPNYARCAVSYNYRLLNIEQAISIHTTWASAMQEVERMRSAKIASLKKQIEKVQNKTFTEPA